MPQRVKVEFYLILGQQIFNVKDRFLKMILLLINKFLRSLIMDFSLISNLYIGFDAYKYITWLLYFFISHFPPKTNETT